MLILKRFYVHAVFALISMLAACNPNQKILKRQNMIEATAHVQAIFKETKTVCFGRFIVEVPRSALVVWGEADIPLGVKFYPLGVDEVWVETKKLIDELRNEKAIYLNDIPLLISVEDVDEPQGKIVTGYDGFEAIGTLRISGFFKWKNDAFIIDSRPLAETKDEVIAEMKSIARRLRQHKEDDVPIEPGNCIEHAFLPDETNAKYDGELVRIGFRLKEFPDTHVSIFVGPSSSHYSQNDSLEWQLDRLEKQQKAEDPNHPNLKTKYFRRGKRKIDNWDVGFEALSRTPELPEAHSIHSFIMHFRGAPADPLKPFLDVRMETGVADDAAGATRPTLTDEEAIIIWDKITSTIHVRPTAATSKTRRANSALQRPLGELAATGRICPESGWWQAEEPENAEVSERRHVNKGEIMPHTQAKTELSFWQKLRKEQASYRIATMWKLVSYDEVVVGVAAAKDEDSQHNAVKAGKKG